jgi:hypothetical protein
MSPAATSAGYAQVPRDYSNLAPHSPGFNMGLQQDRSVQRVNDGAAKRGVMVPSSRTFSGGIVESRSRNMSEQYHYQQYGQPSPGIEVPRPQVEEQTVPVLLCHTCSDCGRMRSAGYHRNHPVVPGKPLILTVCRRCKKKVKSHRRSMSSYTRVRSCTAEDPCDWPRESVCIDLDRHEQRGRRRSREEIRVYRHLPSRFHVIRKGSSQTRLGLRAFQQEQSMPHGMRDEVRMRVSSLSPRRSSRYDGVWPPPDVVPMGPSEHPAPQSNPNLTSRDEVWPPPDFVRTHSYRKASPPPLHRQSSRIIELSPSPPPLRTHSTRVVYREDSRERRDRSISPIRVGVRGERRSEDAEARMMSHPRPYRPVTPEQRNFRKTSDETASDSDHKARGRQESPSRSILKQTGGERETSRRRMSMRESQQSIAVEVGGPRVHFGSERRDDRSAQSNGDRPREPEHAQRSSDGYQVYHNYSRHRYIDDPSPPPPVEEMDRLRVRRPSPARQESYEDEIRIDRARRLSFSPLRRYEEARVRHASPLPSRDRELTPRPPPAPLSPEPPARPAYRYVPRTHMRSITPPPIQKSAEEDITDSDSEHSGEITEVRSWRGIDENGHPATFVEERKTVRMLEQGSERGGQSEFRSPSDRLPVRSWKDV